MRDRRLKIIGGIMSEKPHGNSHVPTSLSKEKVIAFSCAGFAQPMIAQYLGITEETLLKHYKEELLNSRMDKLEMVGAHAFRRAMEGSDKMAELICRTQLRWANAKSPEEIEASKSAAEAQLSVLERLAKQQECKQQE